MYFPLLLLKLLLRMDHCLACLGVRRLSLIGRDYSLGDLRRSLLRQTNLLGHGKFTLPRTAPLLTKAGIQALTNEFFFGCLDCSRHGEGGF
jgi:hypothetical protein